MLPPSFITIELLSYWVTTYYIMMSNVVSSLVLLSVMMTVVVVNTMPASSSDCPDGMVSHAGSCRLAREALDDSMAPKTKRGVDRTCVRADMKTGECIAWYSGPQQNCLLLQCNVLQWKIIKLLWCQNPVICFCVIVAQDFRWNK